MITQGMPKSLNNISETELREQIRDLCKLLGWKEKLTMVSLCDILWICLINVGKPVWHILRNTVRCMLKNAIMKDIFMIRLGMPIFVRKSMVLKVFSGHQILGMYYALMRIVIIVVGIDRNYPLSLVSESLGLTTLFLYTEAV